MTSRFVLNPYLYIFATLKKVYCYIPFKHSFFEFSAKEWKYIKDFDVGHKKTMWLKKRKIYVESNYKKNFLHFYQKEYMEAPKLGVVYLISTDACNFRCTYCFIENNFSTKRRSAAKMNDIKSWVDYSIKNSNKKLKFIFYGGEPLLNKQFVMGAIEYIRKQDIPDKEIDISINTNGSIYDRKLAETFRKNRVTLSISIDGPKTLHDKNRINKRRKGTFKLVESNMLKYAKDKINITLSITVTKDNINYLPQIAEWISEKYRFIKSVGFNPPQTSEKGNPADINNFKFLMLQLYNAFRVFRNKDIYEDRIMRRLKYIINKVPYLKDCAGCGNQLVVDANGKIGPCQAFIGLGKLFESRKSSSYNFSDDIIIKEWNKLTPISKTVCQNCPFILICGNGCPYYSYINTNSLSNCDYRYRDMLPVLIKEVSKDIFYKIPKAIFVDYDDTIILRKNPKELFEEVSNKLGINVKIPKNGFFDVRKVFRSAELSDKEVTNATKLYMKLFIESGVPNIYLLKQLKRIPVDKYILTNNSKKLVNLELKRFNIIEIFNGIFGSNIYRKPQREFYENVFKETHLQPEDILYIGDCWADLEPIYNIGARVVLFPKNSSFGNNFIMSLWKSQKN